MESQELKKILKQYTDNTISLADQEQLFNYLNEQLNLEEIEHILTDDWDQTAADDMLDEAVSAKIFSAIVSTPVQLPHRKNFYQRNYSWISYAAITLITLLGAVYLFNPARNEPAKPVPVVKAQVREDHEKIILPDGSTVVLNSNSKLEYPKDFSGATREVTLSGEGYFDVKHNVNKPFIVHSGKLSTTVLGTAFNIRSLAAEKMVIVTVTRGKVSVSKDHKILGILTPNQQISYGEKIPSPKVMAVTAQKAIEWQSRDIFFKDATMLEAMNELSKRFGVRIGFASETGKDCRLTATFLNGERLDEILNVISAFNGAEFKRSEGGITISGKSCTN